MRPIQVVIATRTLVPLVTEVLRAACVAEPDLALRTTDVDRHALAAGEPLGELADADTLVIGAGELGAAEADAAQRRLVYAHPRTSVLAISADARDAVLLALRPRLTRLAAVAPADIVAAIRAAAHDTHASR